MKQLLKNTFSAMTARPVRIVTACLLAVIAFTGIRIVGLRPFLQNGSSPGREYFSYNLWMLLIALPYLAYFAVSTVAGLKDVPEGTSKAKAWAAALVPLALMGLAVSVLSNNLFRIYAAGIYNTYQHIPLPGLYRDEPFLFDGYFNYETFLLTLFVPMGTLLCAGAAALLLGKRLPAPKDRNAKIALFSDPIRIISTSLVGVVALCDLALACSANGVYPDVSNISQYTSFTRPDYSFAYVLIVIAAAYLAWFAADTVMKDGARIRELGGAGKSAAVIWLKELWPLALFSVALSCVAFGGFAWHLFMNGKFTYHTVELNFGQLPPYVPGAAEWLSVFLISLGVIAIASLTATLLALKRKETPAA